MSSRCGNDYCFLAHSVFLTSLGVSEPDIESLIVQLTFPTGVDDREKWSRILRWAFLLSRASAGDSEASGPTVRRWMTAEEYSHLLRICTAVDLLNRFAEFYPDEVASSREEMFQGAPDMIKHALPQLTKFNAETIRNNALTSRPVVTICAYCKNIRDTAENWLPLEAVLARLDRNSSFSHGICPDCENRPDLQ